MRTVKTSKCGVVSVDGIEAGRVHRVVTRGPRGGKVTQWDTRDLNWEDALSTHSTRADAVDAVVARHEGTVTCADCMELSAEWVPASYVLDSGRPVCCSHLDIAHEQGEVSEDARLVQEMSDEARAAMAANRWGGDWAAFAKSAEPARRWIVAAPHGRESIVTATDQRAALAQIVPDAVDYYGERNENGSVYYWHFRTPREVATPETAVIVTGWTDVDDAADAYPSSAEPCPCGDVFIDGVCDGCGSCSGCDVCEVAGDDGECAYTRAMNAQPSQLGSVAAAVVMGLQGVAVTYSPAGTVATVHREGESGILRTRVKLFNDDAHTYAVVADGGGDYDALCSDDADAIIDWVCNELDVLPVGPSVSVWTGGRLLHEAAGDDAREVLRDSIQFHTPDSVAVIVGTDKHAYAAGGWQAHSETFGADECVVCGDHIEYCAGHGGDGPSAVVGMLATRYPLRAYYAREDDAVAGIESPDAIEGARVRVRLDNNGELYEARVTVGEVTLAEEWADADPWSLASAILSVAGIDAREY